MRIKTPCQGSVNDLSHQAALARENPVHREAPGAGRFTWSLSNRGKGSAGPRVAFAAVAGMLWGPLPGLPAASGEAPSPAFPSASAHRPTIRSIEVEGSHVVLVVNVPEGFRRIILESRSNVESGNWMARELRWPDGKPGDYSFIIPRSEDLEVLRVSATDTTELPFPAEFYGAEDGTPANSDATRNADSAADPLGPSSSETPNPGTSGFLPATDVLVARTVPSARALADRYAAQRSSIIDAHRMNRNPERLSPDFPPRPFATETYARDPDEYLGVVEPGRCWQSAPEESGAPALSVVGNRTEFPVMAGRATDLGVEVPAGAPATFTSFGGGTFPNGLNTITVEADARGRATTTWTASPGTVQEALIVAGSPLTSGTAQFTLAVQGPTTAPQLAITPSKKRGAR